MIRANHAFSKASSALAPTRGVRMVKFSSSSVMPERNLWDTIYSGTKGLMALLASEESRQKFMDIVQGSTINAEVLKKARFGSVLTIALFHDLQDPLFQKYSFEARDFLTGVKPALTNFHETVGQLQNEFPEVTSKEEQAEKLLQRMLVHSTTDVTKEARTAWTGQAEKDPQSVAGQLRTMVSPSLFNSLFLATETEAMMASHKQGSTTVPYVALLSARAMVIDESDFAGFEDETTTSDEKSKAVLDVQEHKTEEVAKHKMESSPSMTHNAEKQETRDTGVEAESTTDRESGEAKIEVEATEDADAGKTDKTPVAAQIEVLYEMTHTVEVKSNFLSDAAEEDEKEESAASTSIKTEREETQIWVGTFEGWLNGGPEGVLRWRITHWRPPHAEFPGLYHGFRST